MGVLSAAGAAAGSFSILIGIAAQRLPPEKRSFAAGLINAGGSVAQSVFAPLVQRYADIFLALLAAAANLPIREARLDAQPVAA